MNYQIAQTIIAGILGGGIIGFIEFLIRRKDEKNDKNDEVLKAIDKLNIKVDERFDTLNGKIDCVDRKGDERNAVAARVRILHFADEMMSDHKHSKDSWDQTLVDCDEYEKYCESAPSFRNNMTSQTIEFIKSGYAKRLEAHDFL